MKALTPSYGATMNECPDGQYVALAEYQALATQNAELVAQNAKLVAQVDRLLAGKWNGEEYKALLDTSTMRDIQAEAGRAGWISSAKEYGAFYLYQTEVEEEATQYAERVKEGE